MWIHNKPKERILPAYLNTSNILNSNIAPAFTLENSKYVDLTELTTLASDFITVLTFSNANFIETNFSGVDNSNTLLYTSNITKLTYTDNSIEIPLLSTSLTNVSDNTYVHESLASNSKNLNNLYIFRSDLSSNIFNLYIDYKFFNIDSFTDLNIYLNSNLPVQAITISGKSYNGKSIFITKANLAKIGLNLDSIVTISYKYTLNLPISEITTNILNYKVLVTHLPIKYCNPLSENQTYQEQIDLGNNIKYIVDGNSTITYTKSLTSDNIGQSRFIDSENTCILIN